jgi:integrase
MLETGMWPEEVFTIRKENMHLIKRYLLVPSGKTRFARRNVPLTDATVNILKARLAKAKGSFVLPHRRDPNRPLTTIHKAHLDALKASENKTTVPTVRPAPHVRFTLRDGRSGPRNSQRVDGPPNISTTTRYVHPTPEHKQEAVRKLEKFNAEQVIAMYENRAGYSQKSPQ